MSYKITCYTLYDITATGVINRPKPAVETNLQEWTIKRNQQNNLDTILQIIGLRSQPEEITTPEKVIVESFSDYDFGFLFEINNETNVPCWKFSFNIAHYGVFNDGITELGELYNDCEFVPMLKVGTEWEKLPSYLDTSEELRNIYFEITELN